jgi:photosystem II stability/assembly factor-like uncharacterized protein
MPAWRNWRALSWVTVMLLAAGCGTASVPGPVAPGSARPSASTRTQPLSAPSPAARPIWLQSVQMTSASDGWAQYWSGNPAVLSPAPLELLARTTDGGRTWMDVTPSDARPLLADPNATEVFDAVNTGRAYFAISASSQQSAQAASTTMLFMTSDSGRTWSEPPPARTVGIASLLSFPDTEHGWMLMNSGGAMGQDPVRVYRTSDGGTHWSLAAASPSMGGNSDTGIPVTCDKTGIAFASATAGWLSGNCRIGLSGALLVSHDGGLTWGTQSLPVPAGTCSDMDCSVTGPQFTGGAGFLTVTQENSTAALLATRDTGQTWQPVPLPAGSREYPQIKFFGPRSGVLVPAGSQDSLGTVFYVTSDGGDTWTAVPQGVHFDENGTTVDFVSPTAGFAWLPGADTQGATPPPVYETANSGRTWTSFTPLLAG